MSTETKPQEVTLEMMFENGDLTQVNPENANDILFKDTEKPEDVIPPVVIEKKEEIIPPVVIKEQPVLETPTPFAELINEYIESGDWQDGQIEIDGTPVLLSELKNVDKNTFLKIQAGQKELEKEKNKDKFIPADGLDEDQKKLIDIIRLKGDVTELLQFEKEVVHPLKGLDLEDEQVQANLVWYKLKGQGLSDRAAQTEIAALKAEFKLDTEAAECVTHINTRYKEMVDAKLQSKQEEQNRKDEEIKNRRKDLSEKYKTFSLKDTLAKNLVDSATKINANGKSKADELFEQAKKDPEFFAELVFHLNDQKGYKEFLGVKAKNTEALKTFLTISTTEKKATSASEPKPEKEDWTKDYFGQTATT